MTETLNGEHNDRNLTRQADQIESTLAASGTPARVTGGRDRGNSTTFIVESSLPGGVRDANNLSGDRDTDQALQQRTGRFAALRSVGGKLRAFLWDK